MKMKHLKVFMLFGLMLSIFACQDQFQSIELNSLPSDPLDWEISNIPSGTKIPNQYIVVFNDNTRRVIGTRSVGLPYPEKLEVVQEASHEVLREAGVQYLSMERTYAEAVSGFVLKAEAGEIEKLRKHPAISYIEQDEIITLAPPCGTPRGGPCPPPDDGGG
ncbi:MAG TPA: protease inhibitor I9 family protein, partial [Saprospiraceae bacterium]|nr:protease inhibitor I9 family protein [Saprospiraceae bacterium]